MHVNYGVHNFAKHAIEVLMICTGCFLGVAFYLYVLNALTNINMDQTANLHKIVQESKITKLYQQILNDLEEGIIIFRKNHIEFKNEVFSQMVQRLKFGSKSSEKDF